MILITLRPPRWDGLAADRNETMQDIIIEAWDYAEKMMIRKHIEDEG